MVLSSLAGLCFPWPAIPSAEALGYYQRSPPCSGAVSNNWISRVSCPGSLRLFQLAEHLQQVVRENDGRVLLHDVRAEPGLVAAELVLRGGGQVAVAAIGEADDHRLRKGTALFQIEARLGEGLERNAAHGEVADAD